MANILDCQRQTSCDYCGGTGEKTQLPAGCNAFEMSIFEIARSLVRVPCHCDAAMTPQQKGRQ
jgi:hypothetical protein